MSAPSTELSCPVLDLPYHGVGGPADGLTRLDALQADGVQVGWVDNPINPYYVCLDRELTLQALQNPEVFSSAAIVPTDPSPAFTMIPVMLDPPVHTKWRGLLASYFSPRTVRALEPYMRQRCVELVEGVRAQGGCDFVEEIALKFPTSIFLEILGLDAAELPGFLASVEKMVKPDASGSLDPGRTFEAIMEVMGRLQELLTSKRENPTPDAPDIISAATSWVIDEEPLSDQDILGCLVLLLLAGLDTVASQLAFSMLHLAENRGDRARLGDADGISAAIEEFIRTFTIPEVARRVTGDTELGGVPLTAGDMVLFPLSAANRDERYLACPHAVELERDVPVPHLGFGAGPHRCLGSHLARQEMAIFFEEWHARIPDYSLAQDAALQSYWGAIHGLRALPLIWTTA